MDKIEGALQCCLFEMADRQLQAVNQFAHFVAMESMPVTHSGVESEDESVSVHDSQPTFLTVVF